MKRRLTACLTLFLAHAAWAAPMLDITPSTFDFGWCPENSRISATFTVKNIGDGMVPLTSVQPTCGCTASNFTPGTLASREITTIGLTFNTRGYNGMKFSKSTKVKTDGTDQDYSVILTGSVLDQNAVFMPADSGIASFDPESSEKRKIVSILNKSDKDMRVDIVQPADAWAKVKIKSSTIKAGGKVELEVRADPPFDNSKETSVTLSATDSEGKESRATIAIRTGRRATVPAAAPAQPSAIPAPAPGK